MTSRAFRKRYISIVALRVGGMSKVTDDTAVDKIISFRPDTVRRNRHAIFSVLLIHSLIGPRWYKFSPSSELHFFYSRLMMNRGKICDRLSGASEMMYSYNLHTDTSTTSYLVMYTPDVSTDRKSTRLNSSHRL